MLKFFDFYLSKVKQTNSIVLRRRLACINESQARRLRTNQKLLFVVDCRRCYHAIPRDTIQAWASLLPSLAAFL